MKLAGKSAIVTGGAMGIGLETVRRLLKEDVKVTIWDLNENEIESIKPELSNFGKVYFHKCDVTSNEQVTELTKIAEQEMGQVDILINNAGYVMGGNLNDQPNEVWQKTIDVNLTALIYTCRAVLPGMYKRNSGHIVNISSASSVLGVGGLSVYSATKWAVWGFTESMRFESENLGKKCVKWSTVHPSYIRTGMFEGAKLGLLGNLITPQVKNHDVIAKAIVNSCLKKGRNSPKRPRTVNLAVMMRGILPDKGFQAILRLLGIPKSMNSWKGRI